MLVKHTYVCEFCHCEYDSEKEARQCEAKGFPEPAPWLPLGEKVYAWGEDGPFGVITDVANAVMIVNRYGYVHSPHEWVICTNSNVDKLSHNVESSSPWFPLDALDPRKGYDAFRYEEDFASVVLWREQLNRFGLKEEDASEYIKANIKKIEQNTKV